VRTGRGSGRPYWIVGLGLLALLVVVFLGAFLVDRQLRPGVGVEPAPTAIPKVGTQFPAGGNLVPTIQPTAISTALAVAPTGTPGLSGVRVADSPLEIEIEAAYRKYWEVRADALLNLNESRLSEVMAGAELERSRQQVAELKSQGRAAKIVVDHMLAFLQVSERQAQLYDYYTNRSYVVDAATKQPIQTPGPGGIAKVSYDLQKIDGVWKVVDGRRHD
jgi:hypothetical protein